MNKKIKYSMVLILIGLLLMLLVGCSSSFNDCTLQCGMIESHKYSDCLDFGIGWGCDNNAKANMISEICMNKCI